MQIRDGKMLGGYWLNFPLILLSSVIITQHVCTVCWAPVNSKEVLALGLPKQRWEDPGSAERQFRVIYVNIHHIITLDGPEISWTGQ